MQGPLPYRSRSIDGPADDYLTLPEVVRYLRLSVRTVRRLMEEGKFPRPRQLSPGQKYWTWLDVVAYREWADRLRVGPVADDEPEPRRPGK